MRPRSGDIWGQGTIRGPRKQGARGDGDHGQVARGPTLTTNTVPGPRARGRVIQRRSGEGWIPRQGRGSSSDPSNTVQVRAHADALPKYWRVERKPKSAREGPGNRPKGPAGMETEGWLHEANPTIEHRPTSARARTRNRAKMWGGTETTDREREHNRAFQHRPSPREGGRITEIFGCGGGGRGASDFRARRATEPTEGAMVGPSPRTCRTGPAPTTNTIRCPRAPGHVIERKCGEGPIPRTGKESPIEPSYGVQVRGSAAALPQYLRGNASRSPRTKGHGTDRRGEGGLRPPTGSTGPNPPKNTRNIWFGWVGGGGGDNPKSAHGGPRNRPKGREGGRSQRAGSTRPTLPTDTVARGREIEQKRDQGPRPLSGRERSIEASSAVQVRARAAALPKYLLGGGHNPMPAHEGPRIQPKGGGSAHGRVARDQPCQ